MRNFPQLRENTTIKHTGAIEPHGEENNSFSVKMKQTSNEGGEKEGLAIAERKAVDALAVELTSLGLSYVDSVNLWISMKSKPALLFCGPSGGFSDSLSSAISHTLVGENSWQSQRFQGHPWWSEKSNNAGRLMMAQQRFTSIRLRSFLAEAAEAENSNQLFFALLIGISRAELQEYFVYLPRQIQTLGGILELPFDISSDPTPYPENMYLIATINLDYELATELEVFDTCTLIYTEDLSSIKPDPILSEPVSPLSIQEILNRRRRFTLVGSLETLSRLDGNYTQLGALTEIMTLLEMHNIQPRIGMVKDAYLFYANSWDALGQGLFDENPSVNTHWVEDFWFQQSVIPRLLNRSLNDRALRNDFLRLLTRNYPRSYRQLTRFLDRARVVTSVLQLD
ncbi:MAG: hypothetical protein A2Z14_15015 [Chloroflexi bacterium RBG_16_48_8]|nr:MAG: hypothetical protein A2Z14_15015 [Chloroflexi bacterium RBG_16_48_8]